MLPSIHKHRHQQQQRASSSPNIKISKTGHIIRSKVMKTACRKTVSCPSSDTCFAYRILPGNNTGVLFSTLSRRPWLRPTKEHKPKANFIWEMYRNPNRYKTPKYKRVILNHIENNYCLVSKQGLYESLKNYCSKTECTLSSVTPITYHLRPHGRVQNEEDQLEMTNFLEFNSSISPEQSTEPGEECVWIVKPSSCANRGVGIVIEKGVAGVLQALGYPSNSPITTSPSDAVDRSSSKEKELRGARGYIVQLYMRNPMLIRGRKFDIRCFVLLILREGQLRALMYRDGYVRTSSSKYNMKNLKDRATHLTNDSVQKKTSGYGKHEAGNKLSYNEWQDLVHLDYPDAPSNVVFDCILPRIKEQVRTSLLATKDRLSQSCIKRSFELLGYDFMVDSAFAPTLIEVNSNPCLEFSSPMLQELITSLIENVFSAAVDRLAPPPRSDHCTRATLEAIANIRKYENKFEDIFLDDGVVETPSPS